MLRVMKCVLAARWRKGIPTSALAWVADYAAVLPNRRELGKDGRTAFERFKGKNAKLSGIEFGEKAFLETLQWRPTGKAKQHVGRRHLLRSPISLGGDGCRQCCRCRVNQDCAAPNRSRALGARGRRRHRRRPMEDVACRFVDRWASKKEVEPGVCLPLEEMELVRHRGCRSGATAQVLDPAIGPEHARPFR